MSDLLDIFIYIYDSQLFINIMEGDGTNLQDEDLKEGTVDYILYDVYSAGHIFDEFDLVASDCGIITLNQLAKEEFKNKEEVIACVLDFIFEGKGSEIKYQIIETEGAKKRMADQEKLVFFAAYCPKCRFWGTAGDEEPCNTCLANPANINSHKPVKFIPAVQTQK